MNEKRQNLIGLPMEPMDPPKDMSILTRVPEKYLLVDTETGQIYQGLKGTNKDGQNWDLLKTDIRAVQSIWAAAKKPAQ